MGFAYEQPKSWYISLWGGAIKLELGDITTAKVDVVVNPTDTVFSGSGGVDRLIHKKAGPALREVCQKAEKPFVGGAVQTAGFGLPARNIIHVAVPKPGHPGGPYLLAACYANALKLANDSGANTVAFAAMGTGNTGIPLREALRIGTQAIWSWFRRNPEEKLTVKILFSSAEKLEIFRRELMLCIVREFRCIVDPAELGLDMLHSLPCILDEYGGLETLPPERKQVADIGREAVDELNHRYIDLMESLYVLIDRPDYFMVLQAAVKRVAPSVRAVDEAFLKHLDEMDLAECICWLVMQQRKDYNSGGVDHDHIRNCSNGNAYRVLGRMERLLRTE